MGSVTNKECRDGLLLVRFTLKEWHATAQGRAAHPEVRRRRSSPTPTGVRAESPGFIHAFIRDRAEHGTRVPVNPTSRRTHWPGHVTGSKGGAVLTCPYIETFAGNVNGSRVPSCRREMVRQCIPQFDMTTPLGMGLLCAYVPWGALCAPGGSDMGFFAGRV
jgi:hypothetical protein